ncbi:MAG: hypothetical protein AB1813_20440, partial [Verrucomicrobiota bacterium]
MWNHLFGLVARQVAVIGLVAGIFQTPLAQSNPDDVAVGTEFWIRGGPSSHLNFQSAGFEVFGTLRLESTGGGWTSALTLNPGALTNNAIGTIVINEGTGGPRSITGDLFNFGAFNVNYNLTLNKDLGRYENAGMLTAGPGATLFLRGADATFVQSAGTLKIDGAVDGNDVLFKFAGGEISGGRVLLADSTLEIASSAGPGQFILTGSASRLASDIFAGHHLWIRGSTRGNHTTVVSESGFANAGGMLLQSVDGGWTSSFTVNTGTLTNLPSGVIEINEGTQGDRNLNAELLNLGTLNVNWPSGLNKNAATHINRGTINIASGRSLTINGGEQTFRHEAGLLAANGLFRGNSIRFQFEGGEITGSPYLVSSELNVGANATTPASFILTHSSSRYSGDLHRGQTLWIRGDAAGTHTTVTAENGFQNEGEILIQSVEGGWTSSFAISNGSLVNASTGVLTVGEGTQGDRRLNLELKNSGRVNVNWPVILQKANATHVNRGEIQIAPGRTLSISGNGQVFRQEAGTFTIEGAFTGNDIGFDFEGGRIVGTPYLVGSRLNVGANALEPASFILTHSASRFTGDLHKGQFLWIRGDSSGGHTSMVAENGFVNEGEILIESVGGGWASSFSINNGALTNKADGKIRFGEGTQGERRLSAELINAGQLTVDFAADLGKPGAAHRNSGQINVNRFLSITGSSFDQEAGTIQVNDTCRLSDLTLNHSGGLTTVNGLLDLRSCLLNYTGGEMTGTTYLVAGELRLGPAAVAPATFIMTHSAGKYSGDLHEGQKLWVRGDSTGGHTTITAENGFTNEGEILIESVSGGWTSSFTVNNGTLVNGTKGVFTVGEGTQGDRRLNLELVNLGRLDIHWPTTLHKSGARHVNRGEFKIAAGRSLNISGAEQVFRQESGAFSI